MGNEYIDLLAYGTVKVGILAKKLYFEQMKVYTKYMNKED
jgi:hypothetical protein